MVREFNRRIGDPTPLLVAGSPWSAHALTAALLRHVVGTAAMREGGPPGQVVVTHPANWGPHKRDQLQHAVELADLTAETQLCTAPVAALLGYADVRAPEVGDTYAVYDLGGGTFDAAVLRCTAEGVTTVGRPGSIEQLGGVDFDDALFHHVLAGAGVDAALVDGGAAAVAALRRLRRDCVLAKESLSHEEDVTLLLDLPGQHAQVRVTRGEFEDLLLPAVQETVRTLRRVLTSAEVDADHLTGVLLAGGSSRMPLVAQEVSAELGRPVLLDAHPKMLVPLGAARFSPAASALPGPSSDPRPPTRPAGDRDDRPAGRRPSRATGPRRTEAPSSGNGEGALTSGTALLARRPPSCS